MPVRNAAPTLSLCLKSLRRQTEQNWQCVVVNDGSVDSSKAILDRAAAQDPRIQVLHTQPQGIVAALGAGLELCQAPLVARMDADDWMHGERLERQCEWLDRHSEISAVGTRVRFFPRSPQLKDGRRSYERWLNGLSGPQSIRADAFVECPIAHPSLTLRTNVLRTFGYREMGWPEDYDLILRLLGKGHQLAVLPKRLIGWRDHPDRLSRTSETYSLDQFTRCKAAHLAADFLKGQPHYVLWGYGQTGKNLRKALLECGHSPSQIVELHPRRIGQFIHGAPVIHPDQLRCPGEPPLIVSVSGPTARNQIREALALKGFKETRDFICAA